MKNNLLVLLGFILLTTPSVATAQFTYITNNGTITITGYTGPGGAVTIPATINGLPVTMIGDAAFDNQTGLTSIMIPRSVISVGYYAFLACTSLIAITVDTANSSYSSLDGVLFNKDQTTLIQCPGGKAGNYDIPNSVKSLGDYSFEYCASLTSARIPGSVNSIGLGVFDSCASLTNITIPGSVTNIGDHAFSGCASLASVKMPGSVTTIGCRAFEGCTSLTNVTVPSSVSSLADEAFSFCSSLTSLSILNGVTSIGNRAFWYCSSLTNVTIPGSVTNLGYFTFQFCSNLTGVFFKGNATFNSGGSYPFDTNAIVYYLPGTTGWGATFAGRPALLWNPLMQSSGPAFGVGPAGFGFDITGTTNIPIVIEAATNLANAAWVPLQSLNLTNGAFYFSDPDWTNYSARFYRIRSP